MGIFLFLLVATLVQVQGDDEEKESFSPYLDADGNLCQDKMETVQDTEYETMIQCRVAMKKSCSQQRMEDNEVDDTEAANQVSPDNACHTVYEKNCKTVYRPHRNKVRLLLFQVFWWWSDFFVTAMQLSAFKAFFNLMNYLVEKSSRLFIEI